MAPSLSEAKVGEVAELSTDAEWESVLSENDVVSRRSLQGCARCRNLRAWHRILCASSACRHVG